MYWPYKSVFLFYKGDWTLPVTVNILFSRVLTFQVGTGRGTRSKQTIFVSLSFLIYLGVETKESQHKPWLSEKEGRITTISVEIVILSFPREITGVLYERTPFIKSEFIDGSNDLCYLV